MAPNQTPGLAGPTRPLGSPEIPQFHLPTTKTSGVYAPRLYGAAVISFSTRKQRISETRRVAFVVPLEASTRTVDWEAASATDVSADALLKDAPVRAGYLPLPAGAMTVKTFTRWAKHFDRWLARTQRLHVTPKPEATPKTDAAAEPTAIGPKRGGVSIELVAIVWELS